MTADPTPDLVIVVTGSRDWPSEHAHVIEQALAAEMTPEVALDPQLLHGACPTGADHLADCWWQVQCEAFDDVTWRPPRTFPADWRTHGKSAGPIRNEQMITQAAAMSALCPVVVLAFPWGRSIGTRGTMRLAREAGLRLVAHEGTELIGRRPPGEDRGRR